MIKHFHNNLTKISLWLKNMSEYLIPSAFTKIQVNFNYWCIPYLSVRDGGSS